MAKDFELTGDGDYQMTNAYRDASREERRRLNRYKKENDISDEHMFYLLARKDLAGVPKERRDGSDTTGKVMLVIAVLLFCNSMSTAMSAPGGFNMFLWAIALVSFVMVIVVYYTGMLNPYKKAVRKVNKYLKNAPEVIDYQTWCESHPLKR
jgi:cation transport ATPase